MSNLESEITELKTKNEKLVYYLEKLTNQSWDGLLNKAKKVGEDGNKKEKQ